MSGLPYVELLAGYERPPGPAPGRVPGHRRVVPMWRGSEAGREGHRRTRTGSAVVAKDRPAWAIAADRSEVAGLVPACAGTDPRPWFDSKRWSDIRACVLLCAVCPVRSACLAGALARKEQFGVWGGVRFRGLGADAMGHFPVVFDDGGAKKPVLSREGKRRIFVGRLVRSIGKPVRVPGPWYVGPWTDPDHARGIERMRFILPANLRVAPMPRWPRELRLLFTFPDDGGIGADGQVT